MRKGFIPFSKGICAGIVIGMAVYASGCAFMSNNKRIKKRVCHAAQTVSELLDNVCGLLH